MPRCRRPLCQCEPVGKMELSNHGERLMQFMCLHVNLVLLFSARLMVKTLRLFPGNRKFFFRSPTTNAPRLSDDKKWPPRKKVSHDDDSQGLTTSNSGRSLLEVWYIFRGQVTHLKTHPLPLVQGMPGNKLRTRWTESQTAWPLTQLVSPTMTYPRMSLPGPKHLDP